ncbi:MAG: MOSC domain-containing protein [Chitinophagaceae bacterium]|nr:MOSC domain-containing protein [Chitinophagaceae bacterium]
MYQLSAIYIYPIKSLGGIALQQSWVLPKGLEHDRRWMLIDEQHQFITQRQWPQLSQFGMRQEADGSFVIVHQGDELLLPFTTEGPTISATVWDDVVQVKEVSQQHHAWFSARLGTSVRLVHFPETNDRPVDSRYALHGEHTSLSDGYPILLIGEASLADLNNRLATPVDMRRFRPNLVFSGGAAFDEDDWRRFSIGEVALVAVKPCARCVLTTVNPDTGERGKEPLATLSTYRRFDQKVLFGQNVLPITQGLLKVGTPISMLPDSDEELL